MVIMGIDPGPTESAYVILIDGKIVGFSKSENHKVLAAIEEFLSLYQDGRLAIEMIASYGMAVGSEVFNTCVWIGRFYQTYYSNAWGTPDLITRNEVKNHVCHSSRAKDSNIRQAMLDRYGPQGIKKSPGPTYGIAKDVFAALAVASTYHDRLENKQ